MLSKTYNVFLTIIIFIVSPLLNAQHVYELEKVGNVELDLTNVYLKIPIQSLKFCEQIVVMQEHGFYAFNMNGDLSQSYLKEGRGPGEFEFLNSATVLNDTLYIYDSPLRKLMKFGCSDKAIVFKNEIFLRTLSSRNFTVTDEGDIYFLNSHSPSSTIPAVQSFNSNGERKSDYSSAPVTAALGRGLMGGGIAYSQNTKSIYYSYLGDVRLFKIDLTHDTLNELVAPPSYYVGTTEREVRGITDDLSALILKAYEISRVKEVIAYNQSIIRVIETGGPRMNFELEYFLDIWDSDTRVETELKLPGGFAFSSDSLIYVYTEEDVKLIENESRTDFFNIYRLTKH